MGLNSLSSHGHTQCPLLPTLILHVPLSSLQSAHHLYAFMSSMVHLQHLRLLAFPLYFVFLFSLYKFTSACAMLHIPFLLAPLDSPPVDENLHDNVSTNRLTEISGMEMLNLGWNSQFAKNRENLVEARILLLQEIFAIAQYDPIVLLVAYDTPELLFEDQVDSFGLSISLRMVC